MVLSTFLLLATLAKQHVTISILYVSFEVKIIARENKIIKNENKKLTLLPLSSVSSFKANKRKEKEDLTVTFFL